MSFSKEPEKWKFTIGSGSGHSSYIGIIFKPKERTVYLDYIIINSVYRKRKVFAKLVALIIKFAQGWMTVDKFSLEAYELESGNPPHGIYAHYGFQPSEGWMGQSLDRTKQTIEKLANWDHKKGMYPLLRVLQRCTKDKMVPPLKMHLDLRGLPVHFPEVWAETNPRLSWLTEQLVYLDDPRFDFSRHNADFLRDQDTSGSPKAYRFDLKRKPKDSQLRKNDPSKHSDDAKSELGGFFSRLFSW